jgi:hypothetical protein
MKKFRGTYMTKEQYTNWLISNIKINVKHFTTAHYPELKMHYSNLIANDQAELVELGFTWEQVEAIELEAYATA